MGMVAGWKSFFSYRGIKRKMSVFLFLVVLFVMVSCLAAMQVSFRIYDNQLYNDSAEIINYYSFSIENELKQVEELSFNVMSDKEIQESLKTIKYKHASYDSVTAVMKLKDKLVEFSASKNYISSIEFVDTYGNEYSVGLVNQSAARNSNLQRTEEIRRSAMALKGTNVWVEPTDADKYIVSARVIRSSNMSDGFETLGTLMIRLDAGRLVNFCSSLLDKYRTNIAILSDKAVIYKTAGSMSLDKIRFPQNQKQIYTIVGVNGKKYFLTRTESSYTHWTYINMLPHGKIYSGILTMRVAILIICCAVFGLAVWIGIRFADGIVEPIVSLSGIMKRVEVGEFKLNENDRFKSSAYNEIGQLYRDFEIMLNKINTLIEEDYVKQLVLKETQYKALQAQINPHFLYNTLESINWLAQVNKQHDIATMVQSLGNLMRNSISNKQYIIPIAEELKLLDSRSLTDI